MAVRELLLKLTGEAKVISAAVTNFAAIVCLPLLSLVPALERGNRDEDDNSLPAVADLDLFQDLKSACELQDKALDRFPSCSSEVNDTLAGAACCASKPNLSAEDIQLFRIGVFSC